VLEQRTDLACDPSPRLHLDATLSEAQIEPVRCVIQDGTLREFRAVTEIRAHLRFGKPQTIRIQRASIDERERDLARVRMNTLQELADAAGFTHEMAQSMLDRAESYASDDPALFVEALTVKRAGKPPQADSVDSGSKIITVTNLDMRVTPRRGIGTVTLRLGTASEPMLKLHMTGDRLDTSTPIIQLRLSH
jgi:hypothetical protein